MNTLIIGGGLSGLYLASLLEARGEDYLLLEARDRFGGRILTERVGDGYFDMGPAWFWPGQPRIAKLITDLGLTKFDQYARGTLTYENEQGRVERGRGFASMEGSWRLDGGLGRLTQVLADTIPDARKRLNAPVTDIEKTPTGIKATLVSGEELLASQVVLALPPRVAAEISYMPALPTAALNAMQGVATWMAGQAKAVAIYDTPFWRDEGLSGDAMSRRGPMVEVHDASPAEGGPYALFGFIGVPAHARTDEVLLRQLIKKQLERLFGPQAAKPKQLFLKDWAFDPHTSTAADQRPLFAHPDYGLPQSMKQLMGGALHFAGTEAAPQFGGYIEGALEAAEIVLRQLEQSAADQSLAS
ncbi:flavin monoamine oxidase family protein [Tateyamaria sp. SN3-11]|uniref:flavin monoamine oxidase family protein n=1 Tax=Tateyamaria sp. SN3-11 TaxID=3092147 RepID=UPI0039E8453E